MDLRRSTTALFAAGLLLALAMVSAPAQAAKRVASVIGNAEYGHAARLANPLNEAADIAAALGRLGFAVMGRACSRSGRRIAPDRLGAALPMTRKRLDAGDRPRRAQRMGRLGWLQERRVATGSGNNGG